MTEPSFQVQHHGGIAVLRLQSRDGTNRLTRACVIALSQKLCELKETGCPLVITGHTRYFSAGADLREISALTGPAAFEFAKLGQSLMNEIAAFPAPVFAAISGYCMGGGLDVALACRRRVAAPNAIFGHRGAALGLITGWGGTQRLPRLVGKSHALAMFIAAEKINAHHALHLGLIEAIAEDPVSEALSRIRK